MLLCKQWHLVPCPFPTMWLLSAFGNPHLVELSRWPLSKQFTHTYALAVCRSIVFLTSGLHWDSFSQCCLAASRMAFCSALPPASRVSPLLRIQCPTHLPYLLLFVLDLFPFILQFLAFSYQPPSISIWMILRYFRLNIFYVCLRDVFLAFPFSSCGTNTEGLRLKLYSSSNFLYSLRPNKY